MSGFGAFLGGLSGGTIGASVVSLILDTKRFDAGLVSAKGRLQSSTVQMQGATTQFGQIAKAGLLAAIPAALAVGKATIEAASQQEEAVNKVRVVFEDASKTVTDFAETSAEAFGISETAALQAAGGFGVMFDTAGLAADESANMSVALVKLASDLSSFNDVDPTVALEKLRAGLAGEAEPLRQLGILLSEGRVKAKAYETGIAEAGAELTEQQKVQARYAVILEDSGKAQGDFARTSDTLANQQRVLTANMNELAVAIGEALIPVFTELTSGVADAIPVLEEFTNIITDDLPGGFSLLDLALAPSTELLNTHSEATAAGAAQALQAAQAFEAMGLSQKDANDIIESSTPIVREFAQGLGLFRRRADEIPGATERATLGIQDFADASGASLDDFRADVRSNMNFVRARFTELAGKAKLTGDQIRRALEDAAQDQRDFNKNVDKFADNVREAYGNRVPKAAREMIAEIATGGEEYAGLVAALADTTDTNLRAIVRSWKDGNRGPQSTLDILKNIGTRMDELDGRTSTVNVRINLDVNAPPGVSDELAAELVRGQTP